MVSPTRVVPYQSLWPRDFRSIAAQLRPVLAGIPHCIEHVGSTSVPGLAAKPIIDLDVVVPSAALVQDAIAALAAAGCVHQGDLGIAGQEAFEVLPGLPHHHLYVVVAGTLPHRNHIDFRDFLRSHPVEAARYAALKLELAHLLGTDRPQYGARKSTMVHDLLAQARAGASNQPAAVTAGA